MAMARGGRSLLSSVLHSFESAGTESAKSHAFVSHFPHVSVFWLTQFRSAALDCSASRPRVVVESANSVSQAIGSVALVPEAACPVASRSMTITPEPEPRDPVDSGSLKLAAFESVT